MSRQLTGKLNKELLIRLYVSDKRSVREIASIVGVNRNTVLKHLKKHDIERRPFTTRSLKIWLYRKHPNLGIKHLESTKEKISKSRLGYKVPLEVRLKLGSKGSKNGGWIDGRTPENQCIRHSINNKLWRADVFKRDSYICQFCGRKGGKLNADHIKPFALYPELRFSISNGRTLCVECHRKTDTYGSKKLQLV